MPEYNSKKNYKTKNIGKLMPLFDLDAEKSVLGALLIDKNAIVKVVEFLKPKHFYDPAHQHISQAILDLYENRKPVDLITVQNILKKMKVLSDVGGTTYLTDLVNTVPTSANIVHYANLIRDDFVKRTLLSVAGDIGTLVHQEGDVEDLLDKAEQLLFGVSQDRTQQDFIALKDVLEVTFERLDELSKQKGALRGVSTGLKTLDKMLSGLQKEELIIIAARPSVGKSSLAINISQHVALKGRGVAFFSLEMGTASIADRMISAQGDIDNFRIATGNLEEEDFTKYANALGELSEANLHIDDTPGISVQEMRTKARRLILEHQIDLIVVDYLQLVRAPQAESRVQEVAKISQGLKNLARELKVPVMALSQLSRSIETRGGDKRPQLSDLRDSGSIEQDADVVMFLYRPDDDDRDNQVLTIAKHRNGPTGEIPLFFKGSRTKYYEAASAPSSDA